MRRARRSSILALLLLTAATGLIARTGAGLIARTGAAQSVAPEAGAGPGPNPGAGPGLSRGQNPAAGAEQSAGATPDAAALDREAAARRQVEESEQLRAIQLDAQRVATEQAARALAEEQHLTAEQSAAFARLKLAEAAVNEMTRHMAELNQRRADAQSSIDKRVAVLRPLLPVIIRMSNYPIETLLASPLSAEDSVRGLLVLRQISREAEVEARSLIDDRQALDAATKAAAEVVPRLAAAEAARAQEAGLLARQLEETKGRRAAAEQDAMDAARRAAAEAARADSLRSMLQILETQRRLEEARAREDVLRAERDQKDTAAEAARLRQAALGRPTGAGTLAANAKPAGQITPPVAGSLVRGWGDQDDGEPATGQSWQTEPGARVVAPCAGIVAFAEAFRGYGLLVIIDCGGGYHAVLGGLDRLAVVPGRAVLDGDPVGTMQAAEVASAGPSPVTALGPALSGLSGAAPLAASPTISGTAPAAPSGALPTLYFELRKAGRPVNPAPWLKSPG